MKTLLYILIFNISALSFAQDPQLFENDWYLQKLIINGENYFPPHNIDSENVLLQINQDSNNMSTAVCSLIITDILEIDNESFQVRDFILVDIECSLQESAIFEGYYFEDFLKWSEPLNTYEYLINIGSGNSKTLTLTNSNNDQAIYGNEALAITDELTPKFSIYPNPVNNELYLSLENGNGKLDIKILNIEGKLLKIENLNFREQEYVDVSKLSRGIYFLKLSDDNGNVEVKKFVKE